VSTTTLYRMFAADGGLLYVGISSRAAMRWEQHRGEKPWWSEVARITVEHFADRAAALAAELAAIRSEGPLYNIAGACRPVVAVPQLPGTEWQELAALEPRLLELQAQVRRPLCGCSDEPLCSWLGLHLRGGEGFKDRLIRLVGWGRGEGWAFDEPRWPDHIEQRRTTGLFWVTARELVEELIEDPRKAEFEAAERAAGRAALFTERAYSVAYERLDGALPWLQGRAS